MAITEHASSPASVEGQDSTSTLTTGSFSPPAGSVVVALVSCGYSGNNPTSTVTDSSGGGSWTSTTKVSSGTWVGFSQVAYKVFTSAPGSITVSSALTNTNGAGPKLMVVKVLEGCDTASPIGATATHDIPSSTTDFSRSITTTTVGAMVYAAANTDDHSTDANTPDGNTTVLDSYYISGNYLASGYAFKSSSPVSSPGATDYGFTLNDDSAGSITMVEFLPEGDPAEEFTETPSDACEMSDAVSFELVKGIDDRTTLSDTVGRVIVVFVDVSDTLTLDDAPDLETHALPIVQYTTFNLDILGG